jgi:hypothetical protein
MSKKYCLICMLACFFVIISATSVQWYEDDQGGNENMAPAEGQAGWAPQEQGAGSQLYGEAQGMELEDLGPAETGGAGEGSVQGLAQLALGVSTCSLWIVDSTGKNMTMTAEMPQDKVADLKARTCAKGDIIFSEKHPNGVVMQYYYYGAKANWNYGLKFAPDETGSYTIWYTIGAEKSNEVKIDVIAPKERKKEPVAAKTCGLATDKTAYTTGDWISIDYWVKSDDIIRLTISPTSQGKPIVYGPKKAAAGLNYPLIMQASPPEGEWTATLETQSGCRETAKFKKGSGWVVGP